MTIKIVGRNIQLSQAIKDVIHERVEKLDKKYFHGRPNYSVKVILKVEHDDHIADILVYKNKRVFKKTYTSKDMYKSIDEAFDIVDRDIRKHKEKLRDQKMRGRQEEVDDLELDLDDDLFEEDENESDF